MLSGRISITCPTCYSIHLVLPSRSHRPHCNRICRSFWARHCREALEMHADGMTWAAIARHFEHGGEHSTFNRVHYWARRLGIVQEPRIYRPREFWVRELPRIVAMRGRGALLREIGAEYGVSAQMIGNVLARYGVPRVDAPLGNKRAHDPACP